MKPSLTPIFLVVELGFLFVLAHRASRLRQSGESMIPAYLHFSLFSVYAIAASAVGASGLYTSSAFLTLLPGLWLLAIPIAVGVLPVLLSKTLRAALRQIFEVTPWHWFATFHALRIGAIGTAYKTWIGEFPAYFEIGVGVPDLLFGISAVWMAGSAKRGAVRRRSFMLWNLAGALAIVPGAPILVALGLPGPLQVLSSQPDARAILTYPMSIAPMAGVPLFVLVNLWVAWSLWQEGQIRREPGVR